MRSKPFFLPYLTSVFTSFQNNHLSLMRAPEWLVLKTMQFTSTRQFWHGKYRPIHLLVAWSTVTPYSIVSGFLVGIEASGARKRTFPAFRKMKCWAMLPFFPQKRAIVMAAYISRRRRDFSCCGEYGAIPLQSQR